MISDSLTISATVVGDPAAGIQEVWVTYNVSSGPSAGLWQLLELAQDSEDSTQWHGTLDLTGTPATDIQYMVHAVNGLGLVGMAANFGASYVPGAEPAATPDPDEPAPAATTLTLASPPTSGNYNESVTVSAELVDSNDGPLAGQRVKFILGSQQRTATTGTNGVATVELLPAVSPGEYDLKASFVGTEEYAASTATADMLFTVNKQPTALALTPPSATVSQGSSYPFVAALTDGLSRPLREQTLFFIVTDSSDSSISYNGTAITDYLGQASLADPPLAVGAYDVDVYFSGTIPLSPTLVLTDDLYLASSAAAALTIVENSAPTITSADGASVAEKPDERH